MRDRPPLPHCRHCDVLRHSSLLAQVWREIPVEQWPVFRKAWGRDVSLQLALDPGPEPAPPPFDDGIPF